MKEVKYLNFPISLLPGLYDNASSFASDVIAYALFRYSEVNNDESTQIRRVQNAAKHFDVPISNLQRTIHTGRKLLNEHSVIPYCSINSDVVLEFLNNPKTDFEIVCFAAYCALKSIVGERPFSQVNNKHLIARMAGKQSFNPDIDLPDILKKHFTERLMRKIRDDLALNWHVAIYAVRGIRGYYVSFKIDLNSLAVEAEKRKKSTRKQQLREDRNNAKHFALDKLGKS